ncbi:MAG: hypothetical protein IKA31_05755, partial [Clostridia bacterium]|nr:hypothetical protein [Clostridia bacterium]
MNNLLNRIKELYPYKHTTISGLNDGEKYFLPYFFAEKTVVVVNNEDSLTNYTKQLTSLGKKVVSLSSPLPLIISVSEKSSKVFKDYFVTLSKIAKGDFDVLLVTPTVLMQKLPEVQFIKSNTLKFEVGKDYLLQDISTKLVEMGYTKQEIVSNKGEYSIRGDLLDVFMVNSEKPVRISFFDTEIEKINYFDPVTFKQERELKKTEVYCSTFFNKASIDIVELKEKIDKDLSKLNLSAEAMIRISNIVSTQFDCLENDLSGLSSVFFLPYCDYFNSSLFDYLPNETTFFIDEPKLITDKLKLFEEETIENFLDLSLKGEFLPKAIDFYLQRKDVLKRIVDFKLIAFARLIAHNKIFDSEFVINFICSANKKYQNHFVELTEDVKNLVKNKNTVLISCALPLTLNKVKTFFDDEKLSYNQVSNLDEIKQGEINLTLKNIPFSVNFEMENFVLIGSKAVNNNQVLEISTEAPQDIKPKFLPKVGEYVVHQIHGVGKCIGIKNLKLSAVYRDYIIIEYKDGDVLYLPSENADLLSAFVGEGNPKCNKIGGTE